MYDPLGFPVSLIPPQNTISKLSNNDLVRNFVKKFPFGKRKLPVLAILIPSGIRVVSPFTSS
jgi:hypothetical protein